RSGPMRARAGQRRFRLIRHCSPSGHTTPAYDCGIWRVKLSCFQRQRKRRKKSSVGSAHQRRSSHVPTIFTLASGRSGTHFLYEIIRRNAVDCVARHETYGFNPSLFGRPIYDYAVGDREPTRRLVERKRRIIESYGEKTYVETSHAFLK